jgi:hypothetical protein
LLVPVVDKVRYNIDMREAVVPFPPQGVITEDNLMVNIDSVIYFQVIDPVRAAYEAQDYIKAIEQLTMTTLRNIIGGLDLESALVSREEINQKLRLVLDEATGKWGIKVNRVVLRAQADRQAQMLRAEGEAQAITTVFGAIHAGQPDQALLAYQYMQMLPAIARGDANKVWIVPSELNKALEGLGSAVNSTASAIPAAVTREFSAPDKVDVQAEIKQQAAADREATQRTVQEAIAAAQELSNPMPKGLSGAKPAALDMSSTDRQTGSEEQLAVSAGDSEEQSQGAVQRKSPYQTEYPQR